MVVLAGEGAGRQRVVGDQVMGDAPVQIVAVGLARPAHHQAGGKLVHRERRHRVVAHPLEAVVAHGLRAQRGMLDPFHHGFGGLGFVRAHQHVQEREMGRVQRALDALQPVAVLPFFADVAVRGRHQGEGQPGQRRRFGGRPHVGPDVFAPFPRGGGLQADAVAVGRIGRHAGHVHAASVHVEFPAVEHAAQPRVLVAAVVEIGTAVRTDGIDHADAPAAVAKGQQVLAQYLDALGRTVRLRQFPGQQHRHPELAQQAAGGGVGAGTGDQFVVFRAQHDGAVSLVFVQEVSCRAGNRW